jgi:hypothetical protein
MKQFSTFFFCLLMTGFAFGQTNQNKVETLIHRLKTVDADGLGFSSFYSGSGFLPYPSSLQVHTLVLGQKPLEESGILTLVVTYGYDAVPILLKYLNDTNCVDMPPKKGMMWMDYPDEYDYNDRVITTIPEGVNTNHIFAEDHPKEHQLTVGDFCFVALGQIVNRSFNASRYQPTGGIMINSPTYSDTLYRTIMKEWGTLTREQHREKLVEDFLKPDHVYRVVGAYQRLSFYYPHEVEKLVMDYLARPLFDGNEIEDFVRKELYKESDVQKQKKMLDQYMKENGATVKSGILDRLFLDLQEEEAFARMGYLKQEHFGFAQPILVQYFGFKATVKSTDRPELNEIDEWDYGMLIESLKHDKSISVTHEIMRIFQRSSDEFMSSSCTEALIARGEWKNLKLFCEVQLNRDSGNKVQQKIYKETIQKIEAEVGIKKG